MRQEKNKPKENKESFLFFILPSLETRKHKGTRTEHLSAGLFGLWKQIWNHNWGRNLVFWLHFVFWFEIVIFFFLALLLLWRRSSYQSGYFWMSWVCPQHTTWVCPLSKQRRCLLVHLARWFFSCFCRRGRTGSNPSKEDVFSIYWWSAICPCFVCPMAQWDLTHQQRAQWSCQSWCVRLRCRFGFG